MEENKDLEQVVDNVENGGEVTLENSNIKIADDVIAVIAGAAASEVPGAVAQEARGRGDRYCGRKSARPRGRSFVHNN